MKTDKEFLQDARDFQRATVKAVSTLIRETPDLLKMLDLRGADFRGADLRDVDFSAALLTGSIFHNADLENAQFQGADFEGAEFDDETKPRSEVARLLTNTADLLDDVTRRGLISDLGLISDIQAQRMSEARDKKDDELASVKALSATLIKNVADRDKEIAALSKNDEVLKDSIARINSLHEIIEARDKEIAELRAEISTSLIVKGAETIKAREQTGGELAEANQEIQRLTLVVAELSRRDRIQGDTIRLLEKNAGRLIEARDKTEAALDSKDELIAELRDQETALGSKDELIAELRTEKAALVEDYERRLKYRDETLSTAPGTIRIEIVRSVDPASKTTAQIVGRIFDSTGAHYSPGFGVKAVVVGRSGSDVLREMSENWSRAGFME